MTNISKIQELEKLKKLKDEGVLTDEEFAKIKQEILYGDNAYPTPNTLKKVEVLLVDQPEPETSPISLPEPKPETLSVSQPEILSVSQPEPEPEILPLSPAEPKIQNTEQPVSPVIDAIKKPVTSDSLSNEKSTKPAGKKINSTLLGFGIAVAAVVFLFIIFLIFSSGKSDKKPDNLTPVTASETQTTQNPQNTKPFVVDDITGIWSSGKETFTIINTDNRFQLWIDKTRIDVTLGNIDATQETASLLSKSPKDGREIVSTLKRKWNSDHSASTLTLILENGQSIDLNFVRVASNDDLNRFTKLAKEQNNKVVSFDKFFGNNTHTAEELTDKEAMNLAKQYAQEAMAATKADDLQQHYYSTVKYFNRGELPLDEILTDKKRYYNKWPNISNTLIGNVKISNGSNGQKLATYSYEFTVSDGKKEITGTAVQYLTLEKIDGTIYVVGENGKTLKSQTTDLTKKADEPLFVPDNSNAESE